MPSTAAVQPLNQSTQPKSTMSAQTKILRTHNVLLHYSSDTPAKPQHPLERAGTSNECPPEEGDHPIINASGVQAISPDSNRSIMPTTLTKQRSVISSTSKTLVPLTCATRGEIEGNSEDKDGASVANPGCVADDGFKVGSFHFDDEVPWAILVEKLSLSHEMVSCRSDHAPRYKSHLLVWVVNPMPNVKLLE
ncbi:hypothetical protein PCANC_16968 [Puccinia coronata f. sp. avenae]|uniref:Uncharacterized protein n=1 Tax=Puccinia coronata f. sp. avenae TaxID=200324 RepID=A0A2N5SHT1_9BASI|nr:hypothetical protein PCANC_16968 [Puccinia coronata f. sp. avenae]